MRRKLFLILSAASLLLCFAACVLWVSGRREPDEYSSLPGWRRQAVGSADGPQTVAGVQPRVAIPAGTRAATTRPDLPVLHAGMGDPAQLTAEQRAMLHRTAVAAAPEGREVWFALVLANGHGPASTMSAVVYFSPDESSPRLRKGRCVRLARWGGRAAFPDKPRSYVQVSPADRPFAGGPLTVPAPADLPFGDASDALPANLADRDLVRLADLTRAALAEEGHGDEPLYRIEQSPDVTRVWTGWQVGGLDGGGYIAEFVRREGRDYERVNELGVWAS